MKTNTKTVLVSVLSHNAADRRLSGAICDVAGALACTGFRPGELTLRTVEAGPELYSVGATAGWACVSELARCPSCGEPAVCCPADGCY